MKRALILFLIPMSVIAFDINGTWVQDKERTLEFNDRHSIQSAVQKKLFECINETIIFNNGSAKSQSDDYLCEHNGKSAIIKGHSLEWQYQIVGVGRDSFVLRSTNSNNEVVFGMYHIVNSNLIWNYSGSSGQMELSHFRTYYKRVN